MDYEKAYKEIFNKAKTLHKMAVETNYKNTSMCLEELFPELAESEDEKIKKFITECIQELRKANPTNADFNGDCSEAIAWLEKQGEQKPLEWSEEDGNNLKECLIAVSMSEGHTLDEKEQLENWLKSLRPQRHPWVIVDKEIRVNEPVLTQLKYKSDGFDGYTVCNDHTLKPDRYERYIKISDIAGAYPQKHWKPKKEYLATLENVIDYLHDWGQNDDDLVLQGLLNELKKI